MRGGSAPAGRPAGHVILCVCLLAAGAGPCLAQGDGVELIVSPGPGADDVTLDWSGGQPLFEIFRATDAAAVVLPEHRLGETDARYWFDTPPAGVIFFYRITSPCVVDPPEVCDGIDNDCDGAIDGPGADATCEAWECCNPPGACGCPPPLVSCAGVCIDLLTDRSSCGSCDDPCDSGEVCNAGTCDISCQAGLTNCGGVCRDLQTDRAHCGGCYSPCAAGQVCSGGACSLSCQAGLTNCGGVCVDTTTDRNYCGSCTRSCAAGQICNAGACQASCQPGLTNCGGFCRDLQYDQNHCGACFSPCDPGEICSSGTCDPV